MITTLLSLALTNATFPPQDPATPHVLPLQHLVMPVGKVMSPHFGSLLQRGDDSGFDLLARLASPHTLASTEDVVTLLSRSMTGAIDDGRLSLQTAGSSLLVGGEAAGVEKVVASFRQMSRALGQSVQIEVAVWDAVDRETPKTVLGADEFQQFIGNRQPLWRSVTTTRPAQAVGLEQMRWTRYVRDIGVEVAQKQTMHAPITDHYGEGIDAVVMPFPLAGSRDLVLHVQFCLAQRRGVTRTVATGQTNAPDIELPTLETAFGAFSGRIPDGGALCATLRGHASSGGQHIVSVRAMARAMPEAADSPTMTVLPIGAITATGLLERMSAAGNFEAEDQVCDPDDSSKSVSIEAVLDLVRAGLGAAAENVTLDHVAGFMFAQGPEANLRTVASIVQGLQDRLLRQVTVVHTGTVRQADEIAAKAPTLHELTLPSLAGRELTVVRCLEMPVLSDIAVEIAQEAGTFDPIVTPLQSGCFLRNRVSPYDDAMHAQTIVANRHVLPPQSRAVLPGGVLMSEETSQVRAEHTGIVANSKLVEHGDGPAVTIDGRSCRSVLTTVVRW